VVFDLDDTLFLERDYVRSGFQAVSNWLAAHHGILGFFDVAWAQFDAGVRGNVFDRTLDALGVGVTSSLIANLVQQYRMHQPAIDMLVDAKGCIARLRCASLRLAIVSDGPAPSQRAKAHAVDAAEWADPVILTADLGAGFSKPHVRAFELVEHLTDCSGAECAYVADNPVKDFAGPALLGWHTVRVRRTDGLHANVPSGPDVAGEIVKLTDLEAALSLDPPFLR